ncbi:MAG: NAD-dependent epimerase/dehydratase family protein [Lachnospiraceae bacterium]|nr:NAD-dependent epimerase/dehydratase family protein [Lachnospiraceae bacterium]
MGNKRAIVTGAAGFAGIHLIKHLLEHGYTVLAVLRPESEHNERICELQKTYPEDRLRGLAVDRSDAPLLRSVGFRGEGYDLFFDLAWGGGRNDLSAQRGNITHMLDAVEAAAFLGCRRFIGIGSQAEYGVQKDIITEESDTEPFSAYGAAKLAACHLSRISAKQAGMEWIWGRIFSLTGEYEPSGRMLPDLVDLLMRGETPELSSCRQNWDYLDASDAAEAMIALGERGKSGEIYNIANGAYRKLREFTEEAKSIVAPEAEIRYGADPEPFVSLAPSVDKIMNDTGWKPQTAFAETVGILKRRNTDG